MLTATRWRKFDFLKIIFIGAVGTFRPTARVGIVVKHFGYAFFGQSLKVCNMGDWRSWKLLDQTVPMLAAASSAACREDFPLHPFKRCSRDRMRVLHKQGLPRMSFFKDFSVSTVFAGAVTVMVGFTSSAAAVFHAAQSAGADAAQMASWIWALGLGMGVTCVGLSWRYKQPVVTAWSTPGAAMLITAAEWHAHGRGGGCLCGFFVVGGSRGLQWCV
jgi:hypothetical protein